MPKTFGGRGGGEAKGELPLELSFLPQPPLLQNNFKKGEKKRGKAFSFLPLSPPATRLSLADSSLFSASFTSPKCFSLLMVREITSEQRTRSLNFCLFLLNTLHARRKNSTKKKKKKEGTTWRPLLIPT